MEQGPGRSLKGLLIALVASNLVLAGVVLHTGRRLESAIRALAENKPSPPRPLGAASVVRRSAPISPEQFQTQWQAHYEAVAETQCWRPHFARYRELPGHLDLMFHVAPSGRAERFELVGYKNPGDAPDESMTHAVFDCVSELLRGAHFPEQPDGYAVRGRISRPNPPARFGAN